MDSHVATSFAIIDDQILDAEDLTTTKLEDAVHWTQVHAELCASRLGFGPRGNQTAMLFGDRQRCMGGDWLCGRPAAAKSHSATPDHDPLPHEELVEAAKSFDVACPG